MKTNHFIATSSMALMLTGCGGSSGSGQALPSVASASGNAMLGPVNGATIVATAYLTGTSLGSTTTSSTGSYTLGLYSVPSGPVVLAMSGGSYAEEIPVGNTTTTTPSGILHAVVPSVSSGGSVSVAITPLTEIAYQQFLAKAATTASTATSYASAANTQVASAFGISDIIGVTPASPTSSLPSSEAGSYELVIAALSQVAHTNGTTSEAVAAAYASSLTTNGVLPGSSTSVNGITLPPLTSGGLGADIPSTGNFAGASAPTFNATATFNAGTVTVPSVISSSAIFWLKADTLSGYTQGASVNSWTDASSSGYLCTLKGNATASPAYVSSGQGGMPAVSFPGDSGGNDELVCNDTATGGPFSLSSGALTVMFVASGSTLNQVGTQGVIHNGVFNAILQTGSSGTPDVAGWLVLATSANNLYESITASMPTGTTAGSLIFDMTQSGTARIAVWENGRSATALGGLDTSYLAQSPYTSGSASGSGAGSAATNATELSIGGRFDGDIQEIVIFPSSLDSTDRSAVECYFAQKYSLTVSGC